MKKGILLLLAGSLLFSVSCKKKGCIDPAANNYSTEAEKDDGSCDYTAEEITTDITSPTVFDNKNVSICGDITISSGLTINPGTTVTMCAGASIEVSANGYITANGTADLPIVFKGATETAGFWEGIAIKSNNPNNQFSYVTVKDAGSYWAWENANVYVSQGSKLSINNSTLSNSEDIGLFIEDGASLANFSTNTFSNNITGLSINVSELSKIDGASSYNVNNTNDFVFVRSGTISVDATWSKTNTPLLLNDVDIEAGLTISAGSNIIVEAGGDIEVTSTGYLKSEGTSSSPVNIKGRYTTAGYWNGIAIKSNNPNNIMTYTTIADGGKYWAYEYSNIYISTGRLDIDNCTISNANSYGIYVKTSSSIYTSGSAQVAAAGVEANNTFTSNGAGPNASCTSGCTVFFQ